MNATSEMINDQLDAIHKHLDEMAENIDDLDVRIDDLDGSIDALNERIDDLGDQLCTDINSVDYASVKKGDFEYVEKRHEDSIHDLNEDVDKLKETVRGLIEAAEARLSMTSDR